MTLTFCIDKSQSMKKEDREGQVKRAVAGILNQALTARKKGVKIKIAIIGFNKSQEVIYKPTEVTDTSILDIKKKLNKYESTGKTNIQAGMEKAITYLESMKNKTPGANSYVYFINRWKEGRE